MTAETDLLPLPEWDGDFMTETEFREQAQSYALANLAERDAEVVALQYRLETAEAYGLQCDADIRSLLARAERLAGALRGVLPFVATQAIGCHGDKCREEWFYSCSGEEEAGDVAQRGREAFRAATAALDQENDDA